MTDNEAGLLTRPPLRPLEQRQADRGQACAATKSEYGSSSSSMGSVVSFDSGEIPARLGLKGQPRGLDDTPPRGSRGREMARQRHGGDAAVDHISLTSVTERFGQH